MDNVYFIDIDLASFDTAMDKFISAFGRVYTYLFVF